MAQPGPRPTLAGIVAEKAAKHGDRAFLRFEGQSLSYRALDDRACALAGALQRQGVGPQSHVALLMDNSPWVVLLYVALARLGAIAVPLNTAAKGEMLRYFLTQADVEYVVAEAAYLERLAAAIGGHDSLRAVFLAPDGVEAPPVWRSRPPLLELAALPPATEPLPEANDATAPCVIMFTSGTTGRSKGVVISQHSILCQARAIADAGEYRPDDVLYTCLPLFHANAWWCTVIPALLSDAEVLLSRRFSASRFWQEVREGGVTQFNLLGAMASFLWKLPESPDDRNHKVRMATVVPVPTGDYEAFERRYGLELRSLYGLTDGGISAIKRRGDPPEKRRAAGRPCDYVEIRIADDDDFALPSGSVGEILLRGREPWALAQGYYGMPEATAATWRNLWLHTGDRGYLDDDGYLYFVDRKKDAIRRRGENISAAEVEHIVAALDPVQEVAAFGVASADGEEEIMIAVVRKAGSSLSAEDLVAHCQGNMPYFMVPRFVEFVAALPRNMSEKVEKYRLRAAAEERLEQIWDRERAGIVLVR